MTDSATDMTTRAIDIGRELVRVCEALGQPIAAAHISAGLDILEAQRDLMAIDELSSAADGLSSQLQALRGQPKEGSSTVVGI